MDKNLQKRIERFVSPEPNTGCWLWLGGVGSSGYGHLTIKGRTVTTQRASYIAYKNGIPVGYEIDHLCRTKLCVNPQHLEAVTREENVRRMRKNSKLTCKYGHQLDGIRTRIGGGRYCKTCVLNRKRNQRAQGKKN